MSGFLDVTVACAVVLAVSMFGLWLLSLRMEDASIVDVFWGIAFVLVARIGFAWGDGDDGRRILVFVLASIWGLRLAAYLLWRRSGEGEDPRYRRMRERHGARFGRVSLFTVFGLQGLVAYLVSMPLQIAQGAGGAPPLGWVDALGAALVATGLALESIGDWQLARFKADPANRGLVMDRGLWRYTRHPNYFGDAVVWWGFGVIACAVPGGEVGLLSSALMTFLLMRVSGVPMLERSLAASRPGWAEYAARTSSFVPWPPR